MKTSIYNQHQQYTEWTSKLNFYKDEIALMQKRIDEISAKNSGRDIAIRLTHFHNQLSIQSNAIRDIMHKISQSEKRLEAGIAANPVASDHRKIEEDNLEKQEVEGFEVNFNNLRHELNVFAAKWM